MLSEKNVRDGWPNGEKVTEKCTDVVTSNLSFS